jgi:hypothetical protein
MEIRLRKRASRWLLFWDYITIYGPLNVECQMCRVFCITFYSNQQTQNYVIKIYTSQQSHSVNVCNLARHWLEIPDDDTKVSKTCRSTEKNKEAVVIYAFIILIVHLLVITKNKKFLPLASLTPKATIRTLFTKWQVEFWTLLTLGQKTVCIRGNTANFIECLQPPPPQKKGSILSLQNVNIFLPNYMMSHSIGQ